MPIKEIIEKADSFQAKGAEISRQGTPPKRVPKPLLSHILVEILLRNYLNKDKRLQQKFPDIDFTLITQDLPEDYRKMLAEDRMKFQDIFRKTSEIKSENGEILNDRIDDFLEKYFNYEPSVRKEIIKEVSSSLKSKMGTLPPIPEGSSTEKPEGLGLINKENSLGK